jgi:hypothetical protein
MELGADGDDTGLSRTDILQSGVTLIVAGFVLRRPDQDAEEESQAEAEGQEYEAFG